MNDQEPLGLGEILITASACVDCGCGSYCHWDDLRTPAQGMSSIEWSLLAAGIECQRCPCKGFRLSKKAVKKR